MTQRQDRPIRIAGASGAASDRHHAMASFAKNYPVEQIDVIINDYLSEANMATAAGRKLMASKTSASFSDANSAETGAFEPSFLEALEPALLDLAKYGIKVVVNAGASDTEALYTVVCKLIERKGIHIPVAWISGDEVLPAIDKSLKAGILKFKNIYTGAELSDWDFDPIYAQAYLGGLGIAEAFSKGAQIVICGRVSDASPVIGAAFWWHGWQRDDLDKLANAFVAGHLIECSTYVTGGNFSGFKSLEYTKNGWTDIGFPIAEITRSGQVVITKQKNTGGAVSVDTCSSQLLYEIQGPWYFNSDVTAKLDDVWFEQVASDRVALHGIKGLPPPPTTKVGITAAGGHQAEACYFLTGLDIEAKGRMLEAQLRHLLRPFSSKYSTLSFQILGRAKPDADDQNASTATFRVFVQARNAEDIEPSKFLKLIIDNVMQGYPGATFHLDFRQGIPKPFFEYYVTLLPQSEIQHVVHFNGKDTLISPPLSSKQYPERQPSQPSTAISIDFSKFGPTERLPLGIIVHARSGDKGSDCNCGFWVRQADEYAWLKNLLSIDTIKELLGKEYDTSRCPKIEIERFELHNLKGVHFLFKNLLDRGVNSTSTIDFLGKNVAEYLRARYVDIPIKFVARGKL